MISNEPDWFFDSKTPVWTGYGRVWLLPEHVLGSWYCVDRDTGNSKWTSNIRRANSIVGVAGKVVVASEIRSDGPWTLSFGCYGVGLDSGKLLWTSHGDGRCGRLLRALDFIPAFTNELRDTAEFVVDSEIVCRSGRILDANSGKTIRRITKKDVELTRPTATKAWQLYQSQPNTITIRHADGTSPPKVTGIQLSDGSLLTHRRSPESEANDGEATDGWHLYRRTESSEAWHFNLATTGYHIDGNFYSYRFADPYVYLIVSEERQTNPHPKRNDCVVAHPTRYHCLSLDLGTGRIVQDIAIGSDELAGCRLQDIDNRGVLLSCGSRRSEYGNWRQLRYYSRVASADASTA
ncbi:MAG: hypothetical protein KDB27_11630 [Planctomycetales bacterium]|nr:hypothetical protein [Planctomycetales bacterium]